ncbi:unnamed protein product [Didymodactylos carnosus]|uniref:Uncharacterized protein n=1 Tax=Didymodactylos carnosus TaxID=1234261 RepID=A0A814YP40_9BILA|nr:unnamed protein product [Didymodactylos carnosus]CAF1231786.1 unnamed protein product [Didymodactylos carnosus]CAF3655793.1 unnamed protein product [Didymodactylos carnosus]CAF3994436.1 unnamed protein product [Didymodactylos carnosus]
MNGRIVEEGKSKVVKVLPKRQICFDGQATLLKNDGTITHMHNLNVGDNILVAYYSPKNELLVKYSPVLAIDVYQHYNEKYPTEYLELHTTSKSTTQQLRITPTHHYW